MFISTIVLRGLMHLRMDALSYESIRKLIDQFVKCRPTPGVIVRT